MRQRWSVDQQWTGGRALRSSLLAFNVGMVEANEAPFYPSPRAALPCQLITAAARASRVRSGGLQQQISSTGAAATLQDAAVDRPRPAAIASRVVGCTGEAGFAAPALLLGAAVVVGGRLGVGVGLRDAHVDQRERSDASHGQPHQRPRTCDGLGGWRTS